MWWKTRICHFLDVFNISVGLTTIVTNFAFGLACPSLYSSTHSKTEASRPWTTQNIRKLGDRTTSHRSTLCDSQVIVEKPLHSEKVTEVSWFLFFWKRSRKGPGKFWALWTHVLRLFLESYRRLWFGRHMVPTEGSYKPHHTGQSSSSTRSISSNSGPTNSQHSWCYCLVTTGNEPKNNRKLSQKSKIGAYKETENSSRSEYFLCFFI